MPPDRTRCGTSRRAARPTDESAGASPRLHPGRAPRVRHRPPPYVSEMTYAAHRQEHADDRAPLALSTPRARTPLALLLAAPDQRPLSRTTDRLEQIPHTLASRSEGPRRQDQHAHTSCISGPTTKANTKHTQAFPTSRTAARSNRHTSCTSARPPANPSAEDQGIDTSGVETGPVPEVVGRWWFLLCESPLGVSQRSSRRGRTP
jgi:hypothetical protein